MMAGGMGPSASAIGAAVASAEASADLVPLTAFRRRATSEPTALTQVDFTYGLPTGAFVSTFSSGTGAASGEPGYAELTTGGTTAGAYVTMATTRLQRFRDGQGVESYIVCKFDTPEAGVVQLAGAFTAEDGFGVGYGDQPGDTPYDADFKVHTKSEAIRQIETLSLSGSSGAGTVDIVLSGVTTTVTVTASTLEQNAAEIAAFTFPGWAAYNLDDTVIFVASSTGSQTGGTYTSASGSPATGAFATTTTGANGTESWIPQADWNVDSLNGTGPSGLTINPQDWNTYRMTWNDTFCSWAWQAPDGRFVTFHRSNAESGLLISNSSLPIQATTYNLQTAASAATLRVAGMAGFCSGPLRRIGARRGRTTTKTSLGATLVPVVSYRLAAAYAGPSSAAQRAFTDEVYFPALYIANDGNKGLIVDVVINADLTLPKWTAVAGLSSSGIREDTSATFTSSGVAGGVTIASFPVSQLSTVEIDLSVFDLILSRGQVLTFAARSLSGATTTLVLSVPWIERG